MELAVEDIIAPHLYKTEKVVKIYATNEKLWREYYAALEKSRRWEKYVCCGIATLRRSNENVEEHYQIIVVLTNKGVHVIQTKGHNFTNEFVPSYSEHDIHEWCRWEAVTIEHLNFGFCSTASPALKICGRLFLVDDREAVYDEINKLQSSRGKLKD